MTAILMFLGLTIGLNCIPFLTQRTFPKAENTIQKILMASILLLLTVTVLAFSGYRVKGLYTFSTICYTFIVSTIAYFVISKNTKRKLLTVLLLTPLIAFSIFLLFVRQPVYEHKIDETTQIAVTAGGFLSCGETIFITQNRFGIFDKEVFHIHNPCLIGINKIETVKLNDKHAEFLIYHNGEHDSENPYRYDMERTNGW